MKNTVLSLSETINWVALKHKGYNRKGTDIPYTSHPFGVAMLLMSHGFNNEETLKAALLHDVVEDTNATLDEIEDKFGEVVRNYVALLTEDKSKAWDIRKIQTINRIKKMPRDVKYIKLGDIVNGLEMMNQEIREGGVNWGKFNRGYMYQKWVYARMLQELNRDPKVIESSLYQYGVELFEQVFETGLTDGIDIVLANDSYLEDTFQIGGGILESGHIYKCEIWQSRDIKMCSIHLEIDAVEEDRDVIIDLVIKSGILVPVNMDDEYIEVHVDQFDQKDSIHVNVILEMGGRLYFKVTPMVSSTDVSLLVY